MIRRGLALTCTVLLAATAVAQVGGPVRGGPTQQPPRQDSGGGGGFGGIGLSLSLGGKKAVPEPPLTGPPLQMRDRTLPDYVDGQVLFFIKGDSAAAARIAKAGKVRVLAVTPLAELGVSMVVAALIPGDAVPLAVERLGRIAGVEWAQPDFRFQVLGNSREQGVGMSGIRLGPRNRVSGTIAMIDSPVDLANPALQGATISQTGFGGDMTPSPHGTAVAELLVGTGTFAGVAQGARLVSLAAFAPVGEDWWQSQTSRVIVAADRALALRPDVLNLSFGTRLDDPALGRALTRFEALGTCVVAAAGNSGGGPVLYPARQGSVLAVTAVDGGKRLYPYASRGPEIDIAAWGVAMNAAVPGGRRAVSGTSFAAAIVSGALLRLTACARDHRPAMMRDQIAAGALDLGPKGRDDQFGAGLLRLK